MKRLVVFLLFFSFQLFGTNYYETLLKKSTSDKKSQDVKTSVNAYSRITEQARRGKKDFDNKEAFAIQHSSRSYYNTIVEDAKEPRWLLPITLSVSLEYDAFDSKGCKVSLSDSLFGEGTTLKDIFLLARLSYEDKLRIHPTGFGGIPQFGHVKEEQYLALLAPLRLALSTDLKSTDFSLSSMYRFKMLEGKNYFAVIGFDLPFGFQRRSIDLLFQDGSLYHTGYAANVTVRETTITQFFKDFSSVEDFFLRAVLAPKGITFCGNQQKAGIGDISLFGILEAGPFFTKFRNSCIALDSAQLGLNIAFPSGTKSTGITLWEIEFGNGGGLQFSFFASANFRTSSDYVNPFFNIGAECNTTFCSVRSGGIRIPKIITQEEEGKLRENPDILLPVFKEYRTLPFEEVDSTITMFADSSTDDATIQRGRRIFFGFGNYIYRIFKRNFRLGLFYTYSRKKVDTIIAPSTFDTSSFASAPDCISHRINWSLTYKFESNIDLAFGSQHIVSGKNVPQQHEVFFSVAIMF